MKFSSKYPLIEFQQQDFAKIKRTIETFPLATLISQNDDFPTVTQVPLIFDRAGEKLLGHFDRNNPHCRHILEGGNISCLFNGPNHYMSPTIYPDEQYPGWNYVAVHINGRVSPMQSEDELADLLIRTAELNEPHDSGYVLTPDQKNFHVFIKMILGFEIEIIDAKGVFKLAQDKGEPHIEIAKHHLAKMAQKDQTDFLAELLK